MTIRWLLIALVAWQTCEFVAGAKGAAILIRHWTGH